MRDLAKPFAMAMASLAAAMLFVVATGIVSIGDAMLGAMFPLVGTCLGGAVVYWRRRTGPRQSDDQANP